MVARLLRDLPNPWHELCEPGEDFHDLRRRILQATHARRKAVHLRGTRPTFILIDVFTYTQYPFNIPNYHF